jgi:hypothetical protein
MPASPFPLSSNLSACTPLHAGLLSFAPADALMHRRCAAERCTALCGLHLDLTPRCASPRWVKQVQSLYPRTFHHQIIVVPIACLSFLSLCTPLFSVMSLQDRTASACATSSNHTNHVS